MHGGSGAVRLLRVPPLRRQKAPCRWHQQTCLPHPLLQAWEITGLDGEAPTSPPTFGYTYNDSTLALPVKGAGWGRMGQRGRLRRQRWEAVHGPAAGTRRSVESRGALASARLLMPHTKPASPTHPYPNPRLNPSAGPKRQRPILLLGGCWGGAGREP